jgi:hypothetical protein
VARRGPWLGLGGGRATAGAGGSGRSGRANEKLDLVAGAREHILG